MRLGANLAAAHPDSPKLFEAVASGDADALIALLEAGVHPDVREFRTNGTALIAAAEGEIECLEALLSYGAAVDAQNKQGETALMAAIKYSDGSIFSKVDPANLAPYNKATGKGRRSK